MTGTLFAHYRVESRLGGGWLGDVYQAWDTLRERRVALRILSPDLAADRDRMYRFLGQVREASAIQHPNIAQTYEIGEQDGTHFIAMEYVEGERLETGMSIAEFLDVTRQIAAALEVMHARRIPYRGIEPTNILRNQHGQIKLLDFGMMKGGRGRRQSAVKETLEHSDRSLPYMPPEQVLERRHEIGRRSDIYSLGVVLYELLSGHVPFRGATVEETISLILHADPPPLSVARPDVPTALDRIVHKCLEKDRDLRYHSVRELLFDLKRFEDDPNSSKTARADRSRSRAPVRAVLLMVVLIAAIAVGGYWLFKKRPPESIAVAPFACEETADVAPFCEGLRADIERRLMSLADVRVVSPPGSVHPRQAAEAQKAGRDAGAAAVLMAEITNRREDMQVRIQLLNVKDGSALWSRSYFRRFRDLLELSEVMASELAGAIGISDLAREGMARQYTASPDAFLAYVRGNYWADRGTPQNVADGVQYLRLAVERDGRFALAWARLAELYITQADLDVAPPAELGAKARQAAQMAMEADPALPEAWSASAQVLYRLDGRLSDAEEYFRKAASLKPNMASPHLRAAELMTSRGVGEEAAAELKRGLELGRSMFRIDLDAGRVLLLAHRFDDALAQLSAALELRKDDPTTALWIALAYSEKGDNNRAVSQIEGVPAAVEEPPLAKSIRAWVYARAGRQADALRILTALEEMSRVRYISPMRFAEIYDGMENRAKELDQLEKALEAGCVYVAFVPRWPMLDSVQQEPRFQDVLRRAGFGPTARGIRY